MIHDHLVGGFEHFLFFPFHIMRLTPDSRAPAKADPSARAGVVVVVVAVVVVGRRWPDLGAVLPLSGP